MKMFKVVVSIILTFLFTIQFAEAKGSFGGGRSFSSGGSRSFSSFGSRSSSSKSSSGGWFSGWGKKSAAAPVVAPKPTVSLAKPVTPPQMPLPTPKPISPSNVAQPKMVYKQADAPKPKTVVATAALASPAAGVSLVDDRKKREDRLARIKARQEERLAQRREANNVTYAPSYSANASNDGPGFWTGAATGYVVSSLLNNNETHASQQPVYVQSAPQHQVEQEAIPNEECWINTPENKGIFDSQRCVQIRLTAQQSNAIPAKYAVAYNGAPTSNEMTQLKSLDSGGLRPLQ